MVYQKHNNQLTLHGNSLNDVNLEATNNTFQAVHTASFEVKGDNTIYTMSLDQPESNNFTYTHTKGFGKVTVNSSGWYDVSYKVGHKFKRGGRKKATNQIKVSLIKNSDDELEVSATWAKRSRGAKDGTNTWRGLLYFEINDSIELTIQSTGGRRFRSRTQKSVLALTKT